MKIRISIYEIIYLILILLCLSLVCCKKEKPVLNLESDTVAENFHIPTAGHENHTDVIDVAVGAMLSPEITRIYYTELLEIVAEKMESCLSVHQRRTYSEINELVENRTVDLALVCTGAYIIGNEDFNMEIIAVPVTGGDTVYYSYIIANSRSNIQSLHDLKGKTFAFTDPESNTGCLAPKYALSLLDETPETFFNDFFFTYSHDNSIKAVAEGLADGAAVDSLIWDYLYKEGDSYAIKTRIIRKSDPYGIPPVVVHPDMDIEKKMQLKHIFLELHEDNRASLTMNKIHVEKFTEVDDSIYDSVRKMRDWVNQ